MTNSITYNFEANGHDFGDFTGATLREAADAFAAAAGYGTWAKMIERADEFGGNSDSVQVRERLANGQFGPDVTDDLVEICIVVDRDGWGDREPTDDEVASYLGLLHERLSFAYPGAEVEVTEGSAGSVRLDGESDDALDGAVQDIWNAWCGGARSANSGSSDYATTATD